MHWKNELARYVIRELERKDRGKGAGSNIRINEYTTIHLAIFREPYLSLLLSREKTLESRFSKNRIGPFNRVRKGDLVVVKKSGGLVVGFFVAGEVKYFDNVDRRLLKEIELAHGEAICSSYDSNFWLDREVSNYISLVEVREIMEVVPFRIDKRDRSGWSIVRERALDK